MTLKNKDSMVNFYTFEQNIEDEEFKSSLLNLELQVLYAGLAGEKKYYKNICGSNKFPMHLRIGSSSDFYSASQIIRKNNLAEPGYDTYILKKQIQETANRILDENWDAVIAIAHTLYQKKRLSFDEVKFILTRRIKNKDFWIERFKNIKFIHGKKYLKEKDYIKSLISENTYL